ncbi:MAG: ribosome maturation factor RimP [Bacteroidetes bacterium]|nr:ribosome maturation factor RimP [Bacteroidota bacterium]
MSLNDRVKELVDAELEGTDYFIVEVTGSEKNHKICVLLDGLNGISIDTCAKVSRSVSRIIDEDSFEADAFVLEISSPGADRPLLDPRQYNKHVGRELVVALKDERKLSGILKEVSSNAITLAATNVKRNKKNNVSKRNISEGIAEVVEDTILPFDGILESTVTLSFK